MMTLEEAIKHCEQKACDNSERSKEHRQLAEWLKELQELRKYTSNTLTYSTNSFLGFLGPHKHRSPRGLRIYFTPYSPMPRRIKYFDL